MSAARTSAAHIPDPATTATARDHLPRTMHGAQNPSGSDGNGSVADMPGSSATRHHERMPWSTTRPRSDKYGREHRAERERHMRALQAAGAGLCAERVCVKRSRVITPADDLHLCHAPDGVTVLGLGHAACNVHAAAVEGNRRQRAARRRRTPPPAARSALRW